MLSQTLVYITTICCLAAANSNCSFLSRGHHKASVFADLSPKEMLSVRNFLLEQENLKLVSSQSQSLGQNTIFMIELHVPKKRHVLSFLNNKGSKPQREARAVLFFGGESNPYVREYVVGPLPYPYYYRPLNFKGNQTIKFESRPMTSLEYENIHLKLLEITEKIHHILKETTGFSYHNCTDRCLTFTDIAPRGLESGERRSWIMLQRFVEGHFLHPTGLEILLNHRSTNLNDWAVEKVWYNGQYFDSVEELVEKYNRNEIKKLKLPEYTKEDLYSTYIPRGKFKTKTEVHGTKVTEPGGKRYKVQGNYVEYTGWSFAFRVRSSAGLQLFDIQFNNERIAYEVSIQEAIAFYGGATPVAMQTKFIDSSWGMGTENYELAKGIDCPEVATYLDIYHFYDTDKPVRYKNAVCIFEQPSTVPLRRHFSNNYKGGYNFYGGLENHALVIRTTSTVYNYDYIWDFIFYQNGVLEAKVHATGYIHSTFLTPEGLQYGSKVYDYVLGNMHTHLIHYKVDLDIAGTQNSFETINMKFENITNPWSPGHTLIQPRLQRNLHFKERDAAFTFGKPLPKYLMFYNPNKQNMWSHHRSYRIQYNSHGDRVLPKDWKEEKGISWARYPLAVTRYKDSEVTSTSLYAQNDPWEPLVSFENFLRNNENIVNEDLVAWVTVGFLHIPHAEDIPNTATPGNAVGFFLRPFNYYDEDPSLPSKSVVIVRPKDKTISNVDIERWTPEVVGECVSKTPFHYNGTYYAD
ncbi:amiloride-sensitive amine oxidase [copper-containing]-like [Rhinatrema bivittatum]|uniref:amiloride-sensitive amine oxidase [copper-containing]-like n=1 Tax=Rhinatrema bivittatum TaxID=194408 RepID=UPI0011264CB2|nr:amiloride-sensitive amine oxidase [copper-containing]-like [Rhinatrema bivittatum]